METLKRRVLEMYFNHTIYRVQLECRNNNNNNNNNNNIHTSLQFQPEFIHNVSKHLSGHNVSVSHPF
jgi:nitrate/nitrite-specific signal transduction histidine kinase